MKLIAGFLALVAALFAMRPAETREIQVYARDGVVLEDGVGGYLIEDTTENLWEFDCEGLSVGQRVVLVMSDDGTPSIYDDVILRVLPLAVADYYDFDNLHFSGEVFG